MSRPFHVYEIYIRTTPEQVWQAITDPDWTQKFFFDCRMETTGVPGSPVAYVTADGYPSVTGTIEEFDPPRRLVTTWQSHWGPEIEAESPSRVVWEIVPVDDAVKLTVTHRDLGRSPLTSDMVGGGWPALVSSLKSLVETGQPIPMPGEPPAPAVWPVDTSGQRFHAIETNRAVWDLLARTDRTPDDDARLLEAAFASRWHWRVAGGPVNAWRGDYMIAKAYLALGRTDEAVRYAESTFALTDPAIEGCADFDVLYANEILARALAAAGRLAEAQTYKDKALALAVTIADAEDKKICDDDLAAGPWYGLS